MYCTKKYDEPNIYITNRCVAPKIRRTKWCMYVMNRSNAPKNEMNQLCILWTDVLQQKIWWIKILWTDVLHLKLQSCTFFSKFANFATFAQSAQVCLFCKIYLFNFLKGKVPHCLVSGKISSRAFAIAFSKSTTTVLLSHTASNPIRWTSRSFSGLYIQC